MLNQICDHVYAYIHAVIADEMEWKKKAVRMQIVICCAIEGFLVEETQLQGKNTTQEKEIDPTPLPIYLFLFPSLCSATPCRTVGMETGWTRALIPNTSLVFSPILYPK